MDFLEGRGPDGDFNGDGLVIQLKIGLTSESLLAPEIVEQPLSQTVNAGEDVILMVSAKGSPDLMYQWRLNGEDIPGAAHMKGA